MYIIIIMKIEIYYDKVISKQIKIDFKKWDDKLVTRNIIYMIKYINNYYMNLFLIYYFIILLKQNKIIMVSGLSFIILKNTLSIHYLY